MYFILFAPLLLASQAVATVIIYRVPWTRADRGDNVYESSGHIPDSMALGVTRNMGVWSDGVFSATYDSYGRVVVTSRNVANNWNTAAGVAQRMRNIIANHTPAGASVHHARGESDDLADGIEQYLDEQEDEDEADLGDILG